MNEIVQGDCDGTSHRSHTQHTKHANRVLLLVAPARSTFFVGGSGGVCCSLCVCAYACVLMRSKSECVCVCASNVLKDKGGCFASRRPRTSTKRRRFWTLSYTPSSHLGSCKTRSRPKCTLVTISPAALDLRPASPLAMCVTDGLIHAKFPLTMQSLVKRGGESRRANFLCDDVCA